MNVDANKRANEHVNKLGVLVRARDLVKLNASTTTRSTTRCSGDLMGDQIASGRPDRSWVTRFDWSCAFWANIRGLLNKCELKQASSDDQMGDQIAPGDQMGDLIFTFWSRWESGHRSGRLE